MKILLEKKRCSLKMEQRYSRFHSDDTTGAETGDFDNLRALSRPELEFLREVGNHQTGVKFPTLHLKNL